MTMTNAMAGFRTTGVCPFDRNVVKSKTPLNPAKAFDPSVLPKETGIKFLPYTVPWLEPDRRKGVRIKKS